MRYLITIRHANVEFSTLRTVGGVGFLPFELINKHSDFYIIYSRLYKTVYVVCCVLYVLVKDARLSPP